MDSVVIFIFVYFISGAVIGLIPAFIASSKGRSFMLWWWYGAALFLFAMIHAIIIKPTEENQLESGGRRCPHCAEIIKRQANVCRFCGRDVPVEQSYRNNAVDERFNDEMTIEEFQKILQEQDEPEKDPSQNYCEKCGKAFISSKKILKSTYCKKCLENGIL